jgi:ribulose-5-phosphate 4-epimerase/fuculose-1-phosphate aldolase
MKTIAKLLFAVALLVCAMISMNSRPGYGANEAALKDLKEKLVLANKILAYEKLATPFGHVSVRIPGTETLLISRSVAPGMVTPEDVLVCDLNGKILEGKYKDTYSELAIHTEVYKKRRDVNSVVHSHSSYVVALSMTDNTVLPFNSVGIGAQPIALFKKRGLIDTPEKGREVCDLMGSNKAVILKAHGAVIIGTSIEDAISRAVSLERMAKLQWKAMCIGKLVPFTEEEKRAGIEIQPSRTAVESVEGLHGLQREWAYYEYLFKK